MFCYFAPLDQEHQQRLETSTNAAESLHNRDKHTFGWMSLALDELPRLVQDQMVLEHNAINDALQGGPSLPTKPIMPLPPAEPITPDDSWQTGMHVWRLFSFVRHAACLYQLICDLLCNCLSYVS